MKKQFDITTIGLINVNVAVSPVSKTIFDNDITLINPVEITPGGDAMNEAITAAALSNKTVLIGMVGSDIFGRFVIETARKNGVIVDYIKKCDGIPTAVGIMLVQKDGQRTICAARGAVEILTLKDIDMQVVENSSIVCIGSIFGLKNLDGKKGVFEILTRAKNSDVITAADVLHDNYHIGFESVRDCFCLIDYFFPSYGEAFAISGEKDVKLQAQFFKKTGCTSVIIKLGADGCFVDSPGFEGIIPPCPGKPKDTSGAGDNFAAGFLTGLRQNRGIEDSVRLGNAVAAISIQYPGSSGAVTSMDQVEEYRRHVGYF
jgi:sugar/nucleoside kinase (ribokinase family)